MFCRKDVLVRAAMIAFGAAGLWLAWSQGQQPAELTIQKLTDSLYVIAGAGSGNVAVLTTGEGVLVVDDKYAQDAPQIAAKIKSVSDKPIKYVVNTHQHGDHTGGNVAMLATGAELLIHKQARANMVAGRMPGLPQITFSDEAQIFLGGKEVMVKHFGRGHTNGDAMVYFPSERAVHGGDLFITGGAPYCDTGSGCSIREWDATVQKALAWDFDIAIPGHGPVAKKADMAKWVQTIAGIRSHVKTACDGGVADAASRLDLKDLGINSIGMLGRSFPGMCQELAQ
jgi:cyclase